MRKGLGFMMVVVVVVIVVMVGGGGGGGGGTYDTERCNTTFSSPWANSSDRIKHSASYTLILCPIDKLQYRD